MTASPPASQERFEALLIVRSRGKKDDHTVLEEITRVASHHGVRWQTIDEDNRLEVLRRIPRHTLVLSVGGDGTFLHAVALTSGHFPLAGINLGHLGYLADISAETIARDLPLLLQGQGLPENRLLIQVSEVPRRHPWSLALNDVVLSKNDGGRMIEIETWIDDRFVCRHRGDGLVVSTATGSTAYALSCGGPILTPTLEVLVLVPISPHNLNDRPLVIDARSRIELRVSPSDLGRSVFSCDGRAHTLPKEGRLEITRAPHHITLLHPPVFDPFTTLRTKLHWGTPPGGRPC